MLHVSQHTRDVILIAVSLVLAFVIFFASIFFILFSPSILFFAALVPSEPSALCTVRITVDTPDAHALGYEYSLNGEALGGGMVMDAAGMEMPLSSDPLTLDITAQDLDGHPAEGTLHIAFSVIAADGQAYPAEGLTLDIGDRSTTQFRLYGSIGEGFRLSPRP